MTRRASGLAERHNNLSVDNPKIRRHSLSNDDYHHPKWQLRRPVVSLDILKLRQTRSSCHGVRLTRGLEPFDILLESPQRVSATVQALVDTIIWP
jgi:hypothetical protein